MKVKLIGQDPGVGPYVASCLAPILGEIRNMGLATGGTMEPLYSSLVAMQQRGDIDLRPPRGFWGLDEYLGLERSHPRSYWTELEQLLFRHIEDGGYSRYALNSEVAEEDIGQMCEQFEQHLVRCGGLDLQLLGIGENGHIGFNEPGSDHDSRTRRVELMHWTRRANARFFGGDLEAVPTHAVTMGIGTALEAKRIWLLATGEKKARAVKAMLEGPISTDCPASALRGHDDVTVFLDQAAASSLENRDGIELVPAA